jgi:hypothetical protein
VSDHTWTNTVQQAAPIIRVRINLSSTVKEGYRLGEATVEWTGSPDPDWDTISGALRMAAMLGQEHAAALNSGEDLV